MSTVLQVPPVTLRKDDYGVLRVGTTRVRLDTVITAWKQGDSPEQIVENFDTLDLADIYGVISYYLTHRTEMELYMQQNQLDGELLRARNEGASPQTGIRERLLARHDALMDKDS